ncbi:MAG TPA: tRNA (guanosine(37)-N1)-methyltransferase TrmD [Blastocatellia bacterium]|nr:tRNA (guanosine(37)-N1)-methyltransferase TrmD [Blastocatellia bacterium]HMV82124.1 tRNA (guanosine(37)-N1)-methyltransferase TrmD [Blastocatellia bacterium]HMX27782.1 tRNA (guanosine(37)-N1)-methyltransferase TrmD [Blastocatellia bacterium]HMY72092.1 tRNA (guanosine(37)-N1)-methyltransferase TrmD [Blastocatellia bacterium]HMZ22543.1 tRNA (guanosine(37)-N1)-methyltransferase TrmD [Blastocatellia bacterium]
MRFDLLTIFPEFFAGPFDFGIIRRARQQGLIEVNIHNLRSFTSDKHHVVDDRPFGGGDGMVLKPEPIFQAVESLLAGEQQEADGRRVAIVLMSPQGIPFCQAEAERFARECSRMILLCGRYEGVDERVVEHLVTDEISIGDYVLTGGELPAMVVVDAVTRLLPNVLGSETSAVHDSFNDNLLDYPHYTRPADFRGWQVPEVLISGHHGEVAKWRRQAALLKTLQRRPDLLAQAELTEKERRQLAEISAAEKVNEQENAQAVPDEK